MGRPNCYEEFLTLAYDHLPNPELTIQVLYHVAVALTRASADQEMVNERNRERTAKLAEKFHGYATALAMHSPEHLG